ncbi:MAG: GreA/GreB family elongation factor [Deltaproteobacteria bacterium]
MELPIVTRLRSELATLQHEVKHELPKRLEEAAAHGDLRENAEYDAAKNRQALVRARLGALQARVSELAAYSLARLPRNRVSYGSTVVCEDANTGAETTFKVLFPEEVDGTDGQISIGSPIGRALLNHEVGDEVLVVTPQGRRNLEIIELTTLHDRESE